ncbi:MAG: matrixin family metalloprotease, partial [Acidobacteriota bacterium]
VIVGVTLLAAAAPVAAYNMIQAVENGRVTGGNMVGCNASGGFVHWSQADYENIRWRLNTSGDGAGKEAAVQAAATAWNTVFGANHRIVYDGTTTAAFTTDGQNTVDFTGGGMCTTPECLGLTALVIQSGQRIVEADITLNPSTIWRTTGADTDTQAVVTHEFGHSLGIFHSTASGLPTMRSEYHGATARTLEADDRNALRCSQNRYGIRPLRVTVTGPSSRNPGQSGTWTCSVSGGLLPYTRSWFKAGNGGITNLGSGSTQSTSSTTNFNIVCDAWDASGRWASDYVAVDVDGNPVWPPIF